MKTLRGGQDLEKKKKRLLDQSLIERPSREKDVRVCISNRFIGVAADDRPIAVALIVWYNIVNGLQIGKRKREGRAG